MERLFVTANFYRGFHKTKFLTVRYGNVLGSRGSIVPTFIDQIQNGKKITITDPEMTRFNITMNDALGLILRALENGMGGEIFIPKLKAYKVKDMTNAILEIMKSKNETEIISVRPGEKYHESLIIEDELRNTFETDKDYIIISEQTSNEKLKKTTLNQQYSSDKVEILSKDELKMILIDSVIITSS